MHALVTSGSVNDLINQLIDDNFGSIEFGVGQRRKG
jgi:hypothetical protein